MVINKSIKGIKYLVNQRISSQVHWWILLSLLFFITPSLSGCVTIWDPEASQEYNTNLVSTISDQTNLGQTFLSRRPNLNGITIWITVVPGQDELSGTAENSLSIKLFHAPDDSSPVFATTVLIPSNAQNIPLFINIPPQKNASGQGYYLLLAKYGGTVQINGRNEDAYPSGQAYLNGKPINADIAFRLSYDYGFFAFLDDIKLWGSYGWLLLPLLLTIWLPGWLLLDISGLRHRFDWGEQFALSNGISLALIPILMLWSTTFKLKLTSGRVLFAAGCLTALFFIRILYTYFSLRLTSKAGLNGGTPVGNQIKVNNSLRNFHGIEIVLFLIFIFSLILRLIMVRDLATPAWVDSVHHALITRLIIENGSFPKTYLPYWDINTTAYHPGFHSVVAVFTWLADLDVAKSLLILGQILNALSVFSVYLFTTTITRYPRAGLFAALITGCITPMPAYYTSWGRYTQLAGLLILPASIAFLRIINEVKINKKNFWIIFLCSITAAGLFMVHYRVIVFLACLYLSYFIFQSLATKSNSRDNDLQSVLLVISVALLALLLISPWVLPALKNTILPALISPGQGSISFFHDFSWQFLTSAYGKQALALAGLGLAWAMIKRQRFALTLIFWTILLFLAANFDALHLPGGGLINNTSVEIILFIPMSILGGYFIDQVISFWKSGLPNLWFAILLLIIITTSIVAYEGAKQLVTIINPVTILSRNADLHAINWIEKNIPKDEVMVINPFPWGYGLYAGSDGGYWISPLSGRQTLPPPVLYGFERERDKINEISQQVIALSSNPVELRMYLLSQNLHYIYIGVKGGPITPEALANSGLYTVLYKESGVWILNIKP